MFRPVFRFAPSPNGHLHLGHAYSAIFTFEAAVAAGGEFLLRIEDIDPLRCRQEYENAIYEDLAWLGLKWQRPVRRQSEHMDEYKAALAKLAAMGVLYPCFASRREIKDALRQNPAHTKDPDGAALYPGIYKNYPADKAELLMAEGKAFNMRLDMERAISLARQKTGKTITFFEEGEGPAGEYGKLEINPAMWGDTIIARKDIPTSYHLSVVVDDALQGISHVTRGQDLFYAAHIHRLLQVLLELPAPRYHHHNLVMDMSGRRLSKSDSDTSLKTLRKQGCTPANIRMRIGLAV